MSIILNSNAVASQASFNLNKATTQLETAIKRLSSGKRISSPSDDAGGLAVAYKIQSVLTRSEAAQNNIKNGISFLQVQDGALQVVGDVLDRMGELKAFWGDISKNASDRETYNFEFQELQKQLQVMTQQTFNGVSLFSTLEPDTHSFKILTTEDGKTGAVSMNRVGLFENLNSETMYDGGVSSNNAASLSSQRIEAVKSFTPNTEITKGDYMLQGGLYYVATSTISADTYTNLESAIGSGVVKEVGQEHPNAKYWMSGANYTAGDVLFDSSDSKYYVATATGVSSTATAALASNVSSLNMNSRYATGTERPVEHKATDYNTSTALAVGDVVAHNGKLLVATTAVAADAKTSPLQLSKSAASATVSGNVAYMNLNVALTSAEKTLLFGTTTPTAGTTTTSAANTQVNTTTIATDSAAAGEIFTATINGTAVTYTTTGAAESVTTIAAGLVAAVNANATTSASVTAANAAGVMTITSDSAGNGFTLAVSETSATTTMADVATTANTAGIAYINGGTPSGYNGKFASGGITYQSDTQISYTVPTGTASSAKGGMSLTILDTSFTELSNYTVGKDLLADTWDLNDFEQSDFVNFTQSLANMRAKNGGQGSRLMFSQDLLSINRMNLEAANGRIIDADMALESTRFARFNVLAQAGAAMVAQANSLSQLALTLLG